MRPGHLTVLHSKLVSYIMLRWGAYAALATDKHSSLFRPSICEEKCLCFNVCQVKYSSFLRDHHGGKLSWIFWSLTSFFHSSLMFV
jgi:hypothetical protein